MLYFIIFCINLYILTNPRLDKPVELWYYN